MHKKTKYIAICYFGLLAVVAFFMPLLVIYGGDSLTFVHIVIVQLLLARQLWKLKFDFEKTLSLWIFMSLLLVLTVFIRDRIVFHFGFEGWYHSVMYYIYIGTASTFWWAMVNMLAMRNKRA